MAELLIQDTSLTSIANAIREKAGLTDSFVFPEGFVEAIAGIEAGGLKVEYGTLTIAEDTVEFTFPHNLGVTPKLYMVAHLLSSDTNMVSPLRNTLAFFVMSEYFNIDSYRTNKGLLGVGAASEFNVMWHVFGQSYADNSFASADSEAITIGSISLSRDYSLRAGATYFYLIAG